MSNQMPDKFGGTDTVNPFRFVKANGPLDHKGLLSYNAHPDGLENPAEPKGKITEYQLKYGPTNKEDEGLKDLSSREKKRVIGVMEKLSTVTQRSYTNPYDSLYGVFRSKVSLPAVDRSKETEKEFFKIDGKSEYQAAYDRYALKESTAE